MKPIPKESMSILLVEDNKTDSFLVETALRRARILERLDIVQDGIEALAFLRREEEWANAQRPDLILLDLNLPRMDGRELLAELKSDPELKKIPVVVLTTSDDSKDVATAYHHHANSFIVKPLHFKDFERALASLGEYWLDIVTLPPKTEEPDARTETSEQGDLKLLLIEDERTDALVVRSALSKLQTPIALTHVVTLAQARQAIAAGKFDIVLTDLTLPDASGLESLYAVRECDSSLPIIVLTGLDDEAKGLEAISAGAEDYLVKGEVKGRALARAIRYSVDKRKSREQLMESQQALFVKGLAGGVAHEVNNLLTQIRMKVDLVLDSPDLNAQTVKDLQSIARATSQGSNLTRQLLTLGRNCVSQLTHLDLNEVVEGMQPTLRSLGEPCLSLSFQSTDRDLPVKGSLAQLEELLTGLVWATKSVVPVDGLSVLRTFDAPPKGEVGLTLTTRAPRVLSRKASELTRLNPNLLEFDEFFLSLILPASIRYVESLGGRVTVDYDETSICWTVAFARDFAGHRVVDNVPTHRVPTSLKVLVVEDQPVILALNTRVLERMGHRVVEASSYQEALERWGECRDFDLLFTDIHLGSGPDGVELSRVLRSEDPDLRCLFCSGYSERFVEEAHGLELGVNFLNKPYAIKDLERLIEDISRSQL